MPEQLQCEVFLSHSAKDNGVVRPLAERLCKDGPKVWFDGWEIAKAKGAKRKTACTLRPSASPRIQAGTLLRARTLPFGQSAPGRLDAVGDGLHQRAKSRTMHKVL